MASSTIAQMSAAISPAIQRSLFPTHFKTHFVTILRPTAVRDSGKTWRSSPAIPDPERDFYEASGDLRLFRRDDYAMLEVTTSSGVGFCTRARRSSIFPGAVRSEHTV
jgi:hypothetical protein